MDNTPEQVIGTLAARNVSTQCARCATPDAFGVEDGEVWLTVVGGQNLRCATLVCRGCGHVELHSLAALGLI